MVLSNKKLKQKLRAALPVVEPVANSGAGSNKIPQTTVPKISDASLKEAKQQLLPDAAAIQKLRLSKREKRRKLRSSRASEDGSKLQTEEGANGNEVKPSSGAVGDVGEKPEKRKKKRKRDQKETEENGDGGDGVGDGEVKKKKKKKNANNKKKKKWSKKNDKAENKESEEAAKNDDEIKTAVVAASNSTPVNNENDRRKVYAGGIPYYSSEDDIRSFFESCGTITELDCMMFPESGKFRGIAIITFKTEEAAKRALALDGADMGGLFLKIQYYNKPTTARGGNSKAVASSSNFAPPVVEGYNRIYMGNLSWDITEDDLRKFLSGCNISSIRFGMDKVTGEFRGYAHVDFSDSLSMNMAMKLDQQILCGRPVKVTSAIPKNLQVLSNTTSTASAAAVAAAPTPATMRATDVATADASVAAADAYVATAVANSEPVVSSGKMRRTCYLCGEKGHISSACPQKPADDPPATISATDVVATADAYVASAVANSEPVVSSGKLRRRTCYVCEEKGHISSACPRKPADDPPAAHVDFSDSLSMNMPMKQLDQCARPVKVTSAIPKNLQILSKNTTSTTSAAPVAVVPTTSTTITDVVGAAAAAYVATAVNNSEPVVSSGKLRRRTCYVCGEKGHISSACPQKPADDPPQATL